MARRMETGGIEGELPSSLSLGVVLPVFLANECYDPPQGFPEEGGKGGLQESRVGCHGVWRDFQLGRKKCTIEASQPKKDVLCIGEGEKFSFDILIFGRLLCISVGDLLRFRRICLTQPESG